MTHTGDATPRTLYHVAYKLSNIATKTCTESMSLEKAVKHATISALGYRAKAKSAFHWKMPNGEDICIEREDERDNPELIPIRMFETDLLSSHHEQPATPRTLATLATLAEAVQRGIGSDYLRIAEDAHAAFEDYKQAVSELVAFVEKIAGYKSDIYETSFKDGEDFAREEIAEQARDLLAKLGESEEAE